MTIARRGFTGRPFSFVAGASVAALGSLNLLNWHFRVPILRGVFLGATHMAANTALGLLLCGLALALLSQNKTPRPMRSTAAFLACVAALIGIATLAEYLFTWNFKIDQLLAVDPYRDLSGFPGRPSPATALGLLVSGIAIICLCLPRDRRWRNPIVSALSATVGATGAIVILAALSESLLGLFLPLFVGVAVPTAVGLLLLGAGILALVRSQGGLVWAMDPPSTIGILVGIFCLLFVVITSNVFTHQLEQADLWTSHTQEVLKEMISVGGYSSDIETATRNYLVTGDERYLSQRSPARVALQEHLNTLRQLTSDNSDQQSRLDQLAALNAQRDLVMEQLLIERRQSGLAAAEASPAAVQERQLSEQARELRKQMRDEEYRLLERRSSLTRRLADRTFLFLPLGLFLSLINMAIALSFLNLGIHGRIQAETALRGPNEHLRASEDRFRVFISGVKDYAIFLLDIEGRVTTWNPGAQNIKRWTADEIVGQHFSLFYSPQDRAAGKPDLALATALATGRFEEEAWRFRKDGSRFWADVLITTIYDDDGQAVGFAKITRDRTEHRRIEQAMKAEEARLVAVIGSAMDAVIIVDAYQRITLFNPAAEKMFGYSESEVMGQMLDKLMPHRFRAAHAQHIRAFAQTNDTRRRMGELAPIYGLRADGEEFPIEASISQTEVQGQRVFSVILRDISERARADEALRQQASLLDLAPVLVRDMQDRIVLWSSSLQSLYGFTRAEALGQVSHELLKTQFPCSLADLHRELEANGRWEGELTHHARDGARVIVNSLWVVYRDSAGQPVRILEVNADITARKRAETLQARSQKLESLGTLSGGIAHDFNNILLAITGNAKLATADLPADHPVQESLAEISRAGARAIDLVRRILTFSRPAEMNRQVLDLRPTVEEALKLVRATLPATIELRSSFSDHLPPVLADSTQIHQIVVNLATNAAHAIGSRSDGVIELRLSVSTLTEDDANPALNLHPGKYVHLLVSDNGCGMDRATVDRIFDPFFTTKAPGEGTGLGLSVVHGIVKNHRGAITVYSEPGRGTAFRLFFPVALVDSAADLRQPEPLPEISRKHTEHILYVDDEEALVTLVSRSLSRLGYKVTGRTDPVVALEYFRLNPAQFDAVVTDLAMPRLSGFDLASQLLAIRPNLPVVMTSGFVRPEDQERALAMGVRDLILKPDSVEQLGRTLDQIFQDSAIAEGASRLNPLVPAAPLPKPRS